MLTPPVLLLLTCVAVGRATCDTCRTRKRLRSAAQVSERQETLGTLQLENQWLNHQIAQSTDKLTASEAEIAQLTALLQQHAPEALIEGDTTHEVVSNSRDNQPDSPGPESSCRGKSQAPAVGLQDADEMQDELWNENSSIQDAACAGRAARAAYHRRQMSLPVIQSQMPSAFSTQHHASEANTIAASNFAGHKRKAPSCESLDLPPDRPPSNSAELVDDLFTTQYTYSGDELSQFQSFMQQQPPQATQYLYQPQHQPQQQQ